MRLTKMEPNSTLTITHADGTVTTYVTDEKGNMSIKFPDGKTQPASSPALAAHLSGLRDPAPPSTRLH